MGRNSAVANSVSPTDTSHQAEEERSVGDHVEEDGEIPTDPGETHPGMDPGGS